MVMVPRAITLMRHHAGLNISLISLPLIGLLMVSLLMIGLAYVLKLMRKGQNIRPEHINQQHEEITQLSHRRLVPTRFKQTDHSIPVVAAKATASDVNSGKFFRPHLLGIMAPSYVGWDHCPVRSREPFSASRVCTIFHGRFHQENSATAGHYAADLRPRRTRGLRSFERKKCR